jgi:hypothetical protein
MGACGLKEMRIAERAPQCLYQRYATNKHDCFHRKNPHC